MCVSGLHLVVLFLFVVVCSNFVFFWFHSFQKRQKMDTAKKKQKKQKCRKKDKTSVSAVVFTNSVPNSWSGLQNSIFVENPIEIVVSPYFEKGKCAKNVKKVESNISPRLMRNITGQIFDSKKGKVLSYVFFLFF